MSAWKDRFAKRRELLFGSRLVPCYVDRPTSIDAMFRAAVARAPTNEIVVDGPTRLTYRDMEERVGRLAAGLAARGVSRGDRVVLFLANRADFITAFLAIVRIGAIAVPVGIRESAVGLAFVLDDCRATAILFEADLADRLPAPEAEPDLRLRIAVGGAVADGDDFEAMIAETSAAPVDVSEEDGAVILYTSGTTGRPKGAILSHVNIVHSSIHFQECWEFEEGERSILAVPASHVTGLVAILTSMIRVAGCVIMMRAFDVAAFLTLAAREKMTTTVLVPAMYNLILLRGDLSGLDLSAWRIGGFGGAPMPVASIEAMAERLPALHLLNAYGSTECATIISLVPQGMSRACIDSVGAPVPLGDLRIVDDAGKEVAPGETGEVWIRGPMTIRGYWERPEATETSFVDGYWRSGDVGSLGHDGMLRLFDRKNDVINRGGFKIYSVEVENALSHHPGVVEAAAVSHPDPVLGEKLHVFVTAKTADLDEAEIRDHCRRILADYKVPDFVTFLEDGLPRNPNGKILKRALREMIGS
ncbi:class I adenylate-forming enzyme family protein [Pinisolibacter aquiterrae]|uniref:class I adenylate-forming enzyme family protein n=1 Tax=Pinisolibacter aquiterrae TaxID=2815579 RepID=UPI001E529203|nr:acyl--CoA ligase [Pinisolibacter aquiterrae]